MENVNNVAILGGGHIGTAIARGISASGKFSPEKIIITRRNVDLLENLKKEGFVIQQDNVDAVKKSEIIIISVQPQQFDGIVEEIGSYIDESRHVLISVVSGVSIDQIRRHVGAGVSVIRAMPNTAVAIRQSMTCLSAKNTSDRALQLAVNIFNSVGKTMVINEEQMIPATALCACGIAFFLRAIRAAAQGGIEIGFHAEEAIPMAAQTAMGAAALILDMQNHPESEIDKVTTPKGCTISGLNEMEHRGFSSALIKGIVTSAEKAACLYNGD